MPIGWWSPSLWDCTHIICLFILYKLNNKDLRRSRTGSICLNRTRRSAAVNQKTKEKKRTRGGGKKMGNEMKRRAVASGGLVARARGAGSSRTCEANEMSRRSIWSEAGPRTQRPNRNYVPHRGDVQEDCLAPFVVNKSAGGVGRGGSGGTGWGGSLFPPCPRHAAPWRGVDETCQWADWKRLPEWTWVSNLLPEAHRLFMGRLLSQRSSDFTTFCLPPQFSSSLSISDLYRRMLTLGAEKLFLMWGIDGKKGR